MTAVNGILLEAIKGDVALVKLLESSKVSPDHILTETVYCVVTDNFVVGEPDLREVDKAVEKAEDRKTFFYIVPGTWKGYSLIRRGGKLYIFCHKIPQVKKILSKNLGAIAKYGAKFYLGEKPEVQKGDVLVSFGSDITNAVMFVWVPAKQIVSVLVEERITVYARLYALIVFLIVLSYLFWAKVINYPVRRLREIVSELETGNYSADFSGLVSMKDEIGTTARLLQSFAHDTGAKKMEFIMDTSLGTRPQCPLFFLRVPAYS